MEPNQAGILKAKSEDGLYYGYVFLPWYGQMQQVRLCFDQESDQLEPTAKQWTALEKFLLEKENIFSNLEEQLFHYYQKVRREALACYEEDYFKKLYPPIENKADINSMVSIHSIVVGYFTRVSDSYIGAIIDCTWDIELGVGVKFINNKAHEISVQDIVL